MDILFRGVLFYCVIAMAITFIFIDFLAVFSRRGDDVSYATLELCSESTYTLWVSRDAAGEMGQCWKIYQDGVSRPVEVSAEMYPTMERAHAAGVKVLRVWQRNERRNSGAAYVY